MTSQVGGGRVSSRARAIPEATVARLAVYLRVLSGLAERGEHPGTTISSTELALSAGVNSAKLRKDLSFLGSYGIRGVGYDVATLTDQISHMLGAHRAHRVALAGLGNLGQALAGYPGLSGRGFVISALFDADPERIGRDVAGLRIEDIHDARAICRLAGVTIGVIATPASAAQEVADTLVGAGIRSILNFAPGVLNVPDDVEVRHVDLSLELQILAFHEAHRTPTAVPAAGQLPGQVSGQLSGQAAGPVPAQASAAGAIAPARHPGLLPSAVAVTS
ncbi:MAG TPA: redox-sensing transcriptional repressor Rex [Nakamurella sp.]|nr:redox-sensing transcriptional repressor Rex [Nakamurella sp.]